MKSPFKWVRNTDIGFEDANNFDAAKYHIVGVECVAGFSSIISNQIQYIIANNIKCCVGTIEDVSKCSVNDIEIGIIIAFEDKNDAMLFKLHNNEKSRIVLIDDLTTIAKERFSAN